MQGRTCRGADNFLIDFLNISCGRVESSPQRDLRLSEAFEISNEFKLRSLLLCKLAVNTEERFTFII